MKECPMCGELMRLETREVRESIPGKGLGGILIRREWVCPECDYFEESVAGEE